MPATPLIIQPGRRLNVSVQLPAALTAGLSVWFEVKDRPNGNRQFAGAMSTTDRITWSVTFPGTDTVKATVNGQWEAASYPTSGSDDVIRLGTGQTLLDKPVAVP